MNDAISRLLLLVNVVVPLVFFMAAVYLVLHIVFARVIATPGSPVLWFFAVVTGPLTRPVRLVLPVGASERRVRAVSLGVYVTLWLLTRALFVWLFGARSG